MFYFVPSEFKELLLLFEQLLPAVPQFLIEEILKHHMELFTKSIADKHCTFCKKQQQMANVKVEGQNGKYIKVDNSAYCAFSVAAVG